MKDKGEGRQKLYGLVVSESRTYKLRKNETKDGGILLGGEGKEVA